jgi:glycosyltransferase involved in cell wall biosynthesis
VAPHLKKFGVSTKIICTASTVGNVERVSSVSIQKSINKDRIEYFEIPFIPLSIGKSNSPIPNIRILQRILNTIDFDTVYFANAYAFQDLFVYMLKILHKKPIISGQHAVLFQESMLHDIYINSLGKSLLKRFEAHHVLNTQDERTFKRWGLKRVYLIPIGVDTQKFKPNELQEKHSKFKVLFVGRLTSQKGIDVLCKSIDALNKNDYFQKNVEYIIVGSGPKGAHIQSFCKQNRNVRYIGRVTEEVLPRIYRNCDLCVMPSRSESFGIVALEAQASGLPVLASDLPSLREIIVNNSTGTLIPTESPTVLASEIKKYYNLWFSEYTQYKQLSRRARESMVRKFGWNIIINDVYNMLTSVHRLSRS